MNEPEFKVHDEPRPGVTVLWCIGVPLAAMVTMTFAAWVSVRLFPSNITLASLAAGILLIGLTLGFHHSWPPAAQRPLGITGQQQRWAPYLPEGRLVLFALLIMVVLFLGVQGVAAWMYSLAGSPGFDMVSASSRQSPRIWVALLTVIVAPVAEELLFRRIVYPALRMRVGIVPSVVISSVAFGLLHANLIQLIVAVPLGVVLALFYEARGSLFLCILGHATFNLLALTLPAWMFTAVFVPPLACIAVAIAGGLIGAWWLTARKPSTSM